MLQHWQIKHLNVHCCFLQLNASGNKTKVEQVRKIWVLVFQLNNLLDVSLLDKMPITFNRRVW